MASDNSFLSQFEQLTLGPRLTTKLWMLDKLNVATPSVPLLMAGVVLDPELTHQTRAWCLLTDEIEHDYIWSQTASNDEKEALQTCLHTLESYPRFKDYWDIWKRESQRDPTSMPRIAKLPRVPPNTPTEMTPAEEEDDNNELPDAAHEPAEGEDDTESVPSQAIVDLHAILPTGLISPSQGSDHSAAAPSESPSTGDTPRSTSQPIPAINKKLEISSSEMLQAEWDEAQAEIAAENEAVRNEDEKNTQTALQLSDPAAIDSPHARDELESVHLPQKVVGAKHASHGQSKAKKRKSSGTTPGSRKSARNK